MHLDLRAPGAVASEVSRLEKLGLPSCDAIPATSSALNLARSDVWQDQRQLLAQAVRVAACEYVAFQLVK
jgi:hypothetical protein